MLNAEDAHRCAGLGGIGAQAKDSAVCLTEIDEIHIYRNHPAQHGLVWIGGDPRDAALEILCIIKNIRTVACKVGRDTSKEELCGLDRVKRVLRSSALPFKRGVEVTH